jgi:hypothetical protein
MLTGNEPGRKAGEPPTTRPTPKDNKAASALRSCSKKMGARRKKGGGAAFVQNRFFFFIVLAVLSITMPTPPRVGIYKVKWSSQVNTLPKAKSQAKDKRAKDRQKYAALR